MSAKQRNAGLDVLRCCAILPVVIYHTPIPFAPLEQWAYIGVEMFFALSGFLIAQMIAERFDGIRTTDALAAFMVNRWMRTLPLYYLFLAINLAVAAHYQSIVSHGAVVMGSFEAPADIKPFLLLTQNFLSGGQSMHWFGVSWTLTLEEWFYVLFPALLFACRRMPLTRAITTIAGIIIVAAVLARTWRYVSAHGSVDIESMFRRSVLLRLDALCYGTLTYVAMARYSAAIKAKGDWLALAGIALLTPVLANHPGPTASGYFAAVAYWSCAPVATCLMIPAFFHRDFKSRIITAAAAFVSTRTYALYLSHMIVALGFAVTIAEINVATLLPLLAVQFIAADAIYRFIERPILRFRPSSAAAWRATTAHKPVGHPA